jgi:hypothetical protein
MLMQPLARKGGGALQPVSRSYQTPAPVGGWNARDSIADMPIKDASILKNWFPGTSRIRVRRGFEEHVTSLASDTETLMVYSSGTADKMFAAANSAIYDVSTAGAVGAAAVSGLTNNRWQYVNMGTSGGRFLIGVNGADTPIKYDGSSWGTSTITGSTSTNFIHVNVFKRRLFFTIRESLKFAYLPVENIAGAAAEFDLAPMATLGGYLMAMGTWTRDGGDGLDDLAVFYTSRGQVLIYQGTDPSDADAWAHIGTFRLGEPVGRRCMEPAGSDLLLISKDGFVPLSTAMGNGRATGRLALSDKIRNAVSDATRDYGSNFGWQAILYPRGQMALFNIPTVEGETAEQYVANTGTGAWCQFTGMNANCWAIFNENLYFGGATAVYKADTGFSDNGENIDADVQQSSTSLGYSGLKAFKMLRPVLTTDGRLTVALIVNIDDETRSPVTAPSFTAPQGAAWNTTPWDTTPWNTGPTLAKDWVSVDGIGYRGAIRMRLTSNEFEVAWNSTDWIFEPGGIQ